jgi:hypothetical protein
MGANDGAVEHQILVVAVGCQGGEHPLPYAGVAPAAEPPMHRLPAAVALRQVTPVRAGSQHPQTAIHEQLIIRSRPARITGLAWQQRRNLRPLPIAQLIPLDPIVQLRARITEPYESAISPLGNPECRSALGLYR